MKLKNFIKINLISMLPILIGCSSMAISGKGIESKNDSLNDEFSSSFSESHEYNYFHYSPELVEDEIGDNCFIVKPLEKGNDYNLGNFRKALDKYAIDKINFQNNKIDEILNFMPEKMCEDYDIEAYRIHLNIENETNGLFYYYAFYKGNVIPVDVNHISDTYTSFYYNFLFTDINNDGYKEISLNTESYLHGSSNNILSIDTKNGNYIHAPYNGTNFKYFKIVNGKPYIYKRDIITVDKVTNILLEEKVSSALYENKRKVSFRENPINATCDNFEAKLTLIEGSVGFPFYYLPLINSEFSFTITVEMKYLGERFHLYSPTTPEPGCYPEFYNDSISCLPYTPLKGQGDLAAIVDIDIKYGDIVTRTYTFDGNSNSTPQGVYNVKVIYQSFQVILKEVLTIEDK